MSPFQRVFVAGTIQGAHRGMEVADQGYRTEIPKMIHQYFPDSECFDPSFGVMQQLGNPEVSELIREFGQRAPLVVEMKGLPQPLERLRKTFRDDTRRVEGFDLCVAYLPGHVPSMGTAMEMYAAHRSGVPIIAITGMIENLAVVSVADWIVRDLTAFQGWLSAQVTD